MSKDEVGADDLATSRQVDWLTNDLKNVDRSKTPWVIVGLQ